MDDGQNSHLGGHSRLTQLNFAACLISAPTFNKEQRDRAQGAACVCAVNVDRVTEMVGDGIFGSARGAFYSVAASAKFIGHILN